MASVTEKVKEGVKEGLVGKEIEEQNQNLSASTRAEFMQHALKDEESGEYYMGQEEFVNAIAPLDEDYVSTISILFYPLHCTARQGTVWYGMAWHGMAWHRKGRRIGISL